MPFPPTTPASPPGPPAQPPPPIAQQIVGHARLILPDFPYAPELPRLAAPGRYCLGRQAQPGGTNEFLDLGRVLDPRQVHQMGVGREHVLIIGEGDGSWWIEHFHTTSGITRLWNGRRLFASGDREALRHGVQFWLGSLRLEFRLLNP